MRAAKNSFLTALLAITLMPVGPAVHSADIAWQSGVHYHRIVPEPPPRSAGQPLEVAEFFWYGCPHCYHFEPYLKKWLEHKPEDVNFTQVPVMFGGPANLHAQAYYALEVTGDLDNVHEELFSAMHNDKKKLRNRAELESWLAAQGVDVDAFRSAFDSFAVSTKVNRAKALTQRYGVRGVPAIVVDGRYRSGDGFRGYEDMVEVTNYLVDKVRNADSKTANVD